MTAQPAGPWIKACLNGSRRPGAHPALPLAPEQTGADAARASAAGAAAVHVHPRDAAGRQALDAVSVGAVVRAVRERAPGVPVGVTTGAWIEPDPDRRLSLVRAWDARTLPDFASVNFSEDGAAPVARLLLERGVGVEAGLWSADDARALVAAGLADACTRLLLEPRERDPAGALETVAAIEAVLDAAGDAGRAAPRLLHGGGPAAWPLLREALRRGVQTRIGLEDTLELPDGRRAAGNAELVAAAVALARRAG